MPCTVDRAFSFRTLFYIYEKSAEEQKFFLLTKKAGFLYFRSFQRKSIFPVEFKFEAEGHLAILRKCQFKMTIEISMKTVFRGVPWRPSSKTNRNATGHLDFRASLLLSKYSLSHQKC